MPDSRHQPATSATAGAKEARKRQLISQGASLRAQMGQTRRASLADLAPAALGSGMLPPVLSIGLGLLKTTHGGGAAALLQNVHRLRSLLPVAKSFYAQLGQLARNPSLKPALRTATMVLAGGLLAGAAIKAIAYSRTRRQRVTSERDSDFSLLR